MAYHSSILYVTEHIFSCISTGTKPTATIPTISLTDMHHHRNPLNQLFTQLSALTKL